MQPLGGTEVPTSTTVHTLNLAGAVASVPEPARILARCRMTCSAKEDGVTMELSVRGTSEEAVQLILGAIA